MKNPRFSAAITVEKGARICDKIPLQGGASPTITKSLIVSCLLNSVFCSLPSVAILLIMLLTNRLSVYTLTLMDVVLSAAEGLTYLFR